MPIDLSELAQRKIAVSMMVDALPEHYYKAELLLYSLSKRANIRNDRIIVQCVDRVDSEFKKFVKDNGYRFREVAPYLDGAYCNKLQQLPDVSAFFNDVEGILLLDVDMVVLDALVLPLYDKVLGKIVDGANPPITVLERIFSAAGVPLPQRISCDWGNGDTVATNFNGGFVYVPLHLLADVSCRWRHWAEWLHDRPELFDQLGQRIHVDQISMALTLAEGRIPFDRISANFNFPVHSNSLPASFQHSESLKILHYHKEISGYGLIQHKLEDFSPVAAAVAQINDEIVACDFNFFSGYKRSLIGKIVPSVLPEHHYLREALSGIVAKHPGCRLIFHAGTPKTGTTSLQNFLDQNRQLLLQHGIFYPYPDGCTTPPKHQWIVDCLLNGNDREFADRLQKACSDISLPVHSIILSTEGIFNHWWDYSPTAKSILLILKEYFEVNVWIWFREPESFASSLYRQNLTNPRFRACYGQDLSFKEMLAETWFVKHLDYLSFVQEVQLLFGQDAVNVITYAGDTVSSFKTLLKMEHLPDYPILENQSINQVGVDLLRVVNRYKPEDASKRSLVALVKQLSVIICKNTPQPFLIAEDDRQYLKQITALGNAALRKEFGLTL
jgi:hypothetical protein